MAVAELSGEPYGSNITNQFSGTIMDTSSNTPNAGPPVARLRGGQPNDTG